MNHELSKECIVVYKPTGQYMAYDEATNTVFPNPQGIYHIFPSKLRAKSAIHVTAELDRQEGADEPWEDYEIIERQ